MAEALTSEHEQEKLVQEGAEAASIASNSWLASLPTELSSASSLLKFKDAGALARSYLSLEKSLGSKVTIPKDDAPDEEWQKFYGRLGMPADKRYLDQRAPEDEEYLQKYEDMFYQSGITARQGKKLFEKLRDFSLNLQKQHQEKLEQTRNSNVDWLKSAYGANFDGKMNLMQAALSKFGTKELASLIEESDYAPPLVDLLVRVGETLQPNSLVTGSEKPSVTDQEGAKKEIKKLESDPEFMIKLGSKGHLEHEDAVKKMAELYAIVYNK